MKKMIAILTAILLLGLAPLALAQGTQPAQEVGATVTVTGTASVPLAPDFATITLGVGVQAATVAAAQAQNATQMTALIDALKAQGIAEKDMQTNYFSINPVYDYNQPNADGTQNIAGYRVDNTLLVTIHDLGTISAVLDKAMESGANQGYGLTFDSTKRAEAYDQALTAAAKEAKRKAAVLAEAADEPLGALVSLLEQTGYGGNYPMAMKANYDAASTPILTGSLTVEATVVATYQAP